MRRFSKRQAHALHEVDEFWIGAQGIKSRVDLEPDQGLGTILVRLLQRFERLFYFVESRMNYRAVVR